MSRPSRLFTNTRSLADFAPSEIFSLFSSWMPAGQYEMADPPMWAACRWATWDEYLADFASVEGALRQRFAHVRREPFAAKARAYRDRHGAAALAVARYTDIRGDDA